MDNQPVDTPVVPSPAQPKPFNKAQAEIEGYKWLIIAYTQTLSSLQTTYLQLKDMPDKAQDIETVRAAINRINSDIDKLKEKLPNKLF